MKKKISNLSILFACVGLLLASCTDSFERYNTNPNELTDEMMEWDNVGVGGYITAMQRDIIPTSDVGANEYQRAQNLTGDIFSGYMAAIGGWNTSNNNSTYNLYFDRWNDVGFDVAFVKVMTAWLKIKNKTEKDSTAFAVANILKVACLHRICDNHGPIPYSKFGEKGLTVAYDSQKTVYNRFFEELTSSIKILSRFVANNPTARPLQRFDLVYEGDMKKWVQYAASLKLRLAMRIVYTEPDLAKKYAEEAFNSPYGLMLTNSDNAILQSRNGIIISHPLKVVWSSYNDTRMGASIESILKGYKDPRLEAYFYPSEFDNGYFGARNGVNIGNNRSKYEKLSSPKVEANTPVQWMCASEVYFLRSEGALRGWNMGGSADELYKEGVRMSFEQHGVSNVENYLKDDTLKATGFTDKVASNSINNGDSRLSTITIKWDEANDFEKNLEQIITQKWIAMFPDGQEAWSEYRRTAYPKIFPVVVNNSGGTIDTKKQIRRIPFPESEYDNNRVEVRKAIGLLGGDDHGGTKLWWDKKE